MRLASILVCLFGCSIPDTQFAPSVDAGGTDSPLDGVLAIVPSVTSVSLDENRDQQFSVTLSRAPATPLSVRVETTSTKLGISVPQLDFTETSFAQPQTVTVTGLADVDVADELASIKLSATGVDAVELSASVHDTDVLAIVTDVPASNIITLDEGQMVNVRVKLSHKPGADVSVGALLATGPVTVSPSTIVFTPQNYSVEQTLRFTAAQDPNVTTDDQALTLRMNTVDRLYTVRSIDNDTLNIAVSPSSLTVTEDGSGGSLNVALTQQPPAEVTVMVETLSGNVTTNKSQLSFTPQNYNVNQAVLVTAPGDPDTEDDTDTVRLTATGVATRDVGIAVDDDDAQEILEDVPGTLTVAENGTSTFNVRLKFQPAGTVTVQVTSNNSNVATASPGVLSFDATNYSMDKPVTVRGTDDNNLATNSTSIRLFNAAIGTTTVPVDATDDDQQRILVSATSVTIPEGQTGGFDVSLMYDPGTTVMATVSNTNPTPLPSSPSSLTFTSSDYNQPHRVTISPPADTNNVSETATITISGAGAASSPTVMATAMDNTIVETWGWPIPFTGQISILDGDVFAFKVSVTQVAFLTTFHTFLQAASGTFKMALYRDDGDKPGLLVTNGQMTLPKAAVNGANASNALATPPSLDGPNFWIAIRFSQTNAIGYAPVGQTGRRCRRDLGIPDINSPWPGSFGSSSCTTDRLFNLWITTFR